jgi:branched-chain amino acid transport system permease protein
VSRRERLGAAALIVVLVALFLLLYVIAPDLDDREREFIRWLLPEAAINEALIWTLAAIGVHVAVDRFGLPDLGAAAYWAIGGYLAGTLMSPFWGGGNFRLLTAAPTWTRGIHLSFWLVLLLAGLLCALLGSALARFAHRYQLALFGLITLTLSLLVPGILAGSFSNIGPIDPIGVAGRAINAYDFGSRYMVYGALLISAVFVSLKLKMRAQDRSESGLVIGSAIAAAIGGVAGVLLVSHSNAVGQDQFGIRSLILVLAVVLFARGSVWLLLLFGVVFSWIYSTGVMHLREGLGDTGTAPVDPGDWQWIYLTTLLILGLAFRGLSARSRSKQAGNT